MRLEARAILIARDDVDTDVLYPGEFLNVTEVEGMRPYLFEGLDPSLRERLGGDTALVVGSNFGCGSSREHVPQAMSASGIRFLIGRSFARIFARNCLNLGLPAVACEPAVAAAREDSRLVLDLDAGLIQVDGAAFEVPQMPELMRQMVDAGGLVPWVRAQLDATTPVV